MNIPFPVLTPRLVDSKWFNADNPCDEEAEIAALEHENQLWVGKKRKLKLKSIGQQFGKKVPLGKTEIDLMDEEASGEEGNESDETEESHDEDEDDVPSSYSPARNNNELEPDSMDDLNDTPELNTSDQSALWPIQ